jgi:hypothetical protein
VREAARGEPDAVSNARHRLGPSRDLHRRSGRAGRRLGYEESSEGAAEEVEALYREQLAAIPEHEIVIVEGSHHYVMFDAPEPYNAHLVRFLGCRFRRT